MYLASGYNLFIVRATKMYAVNKNKKKRVIR